MIMTNHYRKILNYIYKKHTVSYLDLKKRFKGKISIEDLQQLMCQQYIEKSGGNMTVYGGPADIDINSIFYLDQLGVAEVESKQWFNLQFVLLQIILPIVIAVISTLLTVFLTAMLSPFL